MIKGTILQRNPTIVNIYASNVSAPEKEPLLNIKGQINHNMVIAVDFNTPFINR
jgi:hypothetical protein